MSKGFFVSSWQVIRPDIFSYKNATASQLDCSLNLILLTMEPSLIDVRRWMTRYIMSVFLVAGFLGNLFNIYVFTRKDFLKNSCCLYLFAASVLNLFTVSWGIAPSLYNLDNVDPSTYSFVYCKLRLYTTHTLLMIGRTLIVLACVDRFALCSGFLRLRVFRQPKTAIRCIIGTCLIWPILTVHIPIMQNFLGNRCAMTGAYILIYGLYSSMAAGLCPPVLMTVFSLLAIRYRRQLQTRLNTTRKVSKRDHAMMVMLMSEVVVYVISTSLYPTVTLYLAITNQYTKGTERVQIESFVNYLGGSFLIYLNPASAFFVYIIASQSFRKEVRHVVTYRHRLPIGQGAKVNPISSQTHYELRQRNRSTFI